MLPHRLFRSRCTALDTPLREALLLHFLARGQVHCRHAHIGHLDDRLALRTACLASERQPPQFPIPAPVANEGCKVNVMPSTAPPAPHAQAVAVAGEVRDGVKRDWGKHGERLAEERQPGKRAVV